MTETVWQRVRDGDGAAFSELFDDYSALIYDVAFRRTGSYEADQSLLRNLMAPKNAGDQASWMCDVDDVSGGRNRAAIGRFQT